MSEKAILDANFLVACIREEDIWHSKAVALRKRLKKENMEGLFLDCVLNEVFSVLCRKAEESGESEKFNKTIDTIVREIPEEMVIWVYSRMSYYYRSILSLLKEHRGRLNFHDALIAVTAKEKGIKTIVSFDKDFDKVPWLKRVGENHKL